MELKPAHEIYCQALVSSKSKTLAYAEAYPKAKYASCRQGGWRLSTKSYIRLRLQELLDQNGLGLDQCLKKLKDLTEAKKYHNYGQGRTVFVADNFVRLSAVQTALRIHVLLGDVQPVNEADGVDI